MNGTEFTLVAIVLANIEKLIISVCNDLIKWHPIPTDDKTYRLQFGCTKFDIRHKIG